jgi:AcrR family transcriptional regulator
VERAIPLGAKQRTDDAQPREGGLGVRSPVSHKLHPTAQKILTAARRVITERGYQGLTLQAISSEAGVNKSGVWYYFGGKQQLVLALLEEVTVVESHHFGAAPAADATLEERIELIVGSAEQVEDRVRRFAAFYELLPEASRDAELREHLMAYYQGWYAWASETLASSRADAGTHLRDPATIGQFASILLDGIFMQLVVAAPGFDLEAALAHARQTLRHLLAESDPPDRAPRRAERPPRGSKGRGV